MRKALTLIALLMLTVILVCGASFLTDKANFKTWTVQDKGPKPAGIAWAPFYWGGDSFGKKYIERAAVQIPVKIDGFPFTYRFQFDLGAGLTEIYEKNLRSLFAIAPGLKDKIGRLKGPLQFWDSRLSVNNVRFQLGDIIAANEHCYLHRGYGEALPIENASDASFLQLGTIGADLFQNKVLIVDYPAQRFAICDTLPSSYKTAFVDIELDNAGRVILPMLLKGKRYRVTFDTGSSIFPLMTQAEYPAQFATGADTDTLQISSWGQLHNVTGKLLSDSFELAGRKFANVKVYANHTGYGIDKNTDAMAGNALFWNNTVIIDFKAKKFGVKE